ncbi:DUF3800 domain-containing protein [Thiohalobacter sp. IOR34]|uniref:DUF3800 domain-containing protein n=1 Tax=Thiohalobacter sp. IOR34 TaxID=3057176 RepID=UPI0025B024CB|nr:DUF3800 domain-containing protein [Thiohalobacter sp. IOR34]WJW75385.1 DUF3800 domain-containing protein [Thiohalobacter sp. IOR34]
MKFAYIDESGCSDEGDVFVMAGLLIDAYRLRKYTNKFDHELKEFLARHPGTPKELKTKAFINGKGGWNKVSPDERKAFLSEMCDIAVECSKIYAFGMSFQAFEAACASGKYMVPCSGNYWALNGMFICGLIQKKMQIIKNNKGLTVLIFDDNRAHMPKVSDGLYLADPWFDGLYQQSKKVRGKTKWLDLKEEDRFDHIVNTAFAIKSEYSSLIQIADAVSYVYRRHLELTTEPEAYAGEKVFFDGLAHKLNSRRERLLSLA